jgi:hypothetical protein
MMRFVRLIFRLAGDGGARQTGKDYLESGTRASSRMPENRHCEIDNIAAEMVYLVQSKEKQAPPPLVAALELCSRT